MPDSITALRDDADLLDPFALDWLDPPQQGPLTVPRAVTKAIRSYHFEEGTIEIDTAGPPLSLSRCNVQGFNYNFGSQDPVLLGDNLAGKMPVHLVFDPPVRTVAANVSAVGPVGKAYLAQINARLADGSWHTVVASAVLSRKRGSAPLIGARANPGSVITEVWFDVADPANAADFQRVAINWLRWEPT